MGSHARFCVRRRLGRVLFLASLTLFHVSEAVRNLPAQEQSGSPIANTPPVSAEAQALLQENVQLIQKAQELLASQKIAEAIPLAIRISQNLEKASSPQDPTVSRSLLDVSSLYVSQGDIRNALEYSKKALQVALKKYPEDSIVASQFYYHLQSLLNSNELYDEAEKFSKKAIAIQEKRLGAVHLDTSTSLNDLGVILSNQDRNEESEEIQYRWGKRIQSACTT